MTTKNVVNCLTFAKKIRTRLELTSYIFFMCFVCFFKLIFGQIKAKEYPTGIEMGPHCVRDSCRD